MTQQGGVYAKESVDGRYIYYAKFDTFLPTLWRMPVNGGGKDCFTCQRQEYLCGTITQYGAPFNCVDQRVDCSGS